jgi:hypothetical protein
MHTHTHTHAHTSTHARTHTRTHARTHMHTRARVCVHACVHAVRVCVCLHLLCMCACVSVCLCLLLGQIFVAEVRNRDILCPLRQTAIFVFYCDKSRYFKISEMNRDFCAFSASLLLFSSYCLRLGLLNLTEFAKSLYSQILLRYCRDFSKFHCNNAAIFPIFAAILPRYLVFLLVTTRSTAIFCLYDRDKYLPLCCASVSVQCVRASGLCVCTCVRLCGCVVRGIIHNKGSMDKMSNSQTWRIFQETNFKAHARHNSF